MLLHGLDTVARQRMRLEVRVLAPRQKVLLALELLKELQ